VAEDSEKSPMLLNVNILLPILSGVLQHLHCRFFGWLRREREGGKSKLSTYTHTYSFLPIRGSASILR
jgi:hypothetical protein